MKKYLALMCSSAAAMAAFAHIEMGAPFSDGAVLQRGMKVPVWGKATAGNVITVAFAGQSVSAKVGVDGVWRADLEPLTASAEGMPLAVTEKTPGFFFDSTVDAVEIKDVLVGEVWLAAGQSNMECPIWGGNPRYRDGKGGLMTKMTRLPLVRYVKIPRTWSPTPLARKAKWCRFTPEELVPSFNGSKEYPSALAFYYARELYLALGIPVGIVDTSWGGTNIDAWTPRCGYENCDPVLKEEANYVVKAEKDWKKETDAKGAIYAPHQQPTVLWNGMTAAFAPMAARGFIWYQGCHNNWEGLRYAAKMHALYDGWSKAFENPDLKLYFVELAPWNQNWPNLCAAQEKFAAEEKNAALAVTSDVGNFDDIHPNDKETVAKRLAVHALKRDYGFDIPEDSSPLYRSAEFRDGEARLTFDHVQKWYVYAPNRSREPAFEVAGEDGVWQAAKITNFAGWKDKDGQHYTDHIEGATLVLKSDRVAKPVKARYLVKPRTMGTLYNEASLPLGVFETK